MSERLRIHYRERSANQTDVLQHLLKCSKSFIPPLHERVNIDDYASKITCKAHTFEAWIDNNLVGLVAAYLNETTTAKNGFVTNVSVESRYSGKGIATQLMRNCHRKALELGLERLSLEVAVANDVALQMYKKLGYFPVCTEADIVKLELNCGIIE